MSLSSLWILCQRPPTRVVPRDVLSLVLEDQLAVDLAVAGDVPLSLVRPAVVPLTLTVFEERHTLTVGPSDAITLEDA